MSKHVLNTRLSAGCLAQETRRCQEILGHKATRSWRIYVGALAACSQALCADEERKHQCICNPEGER